MTLAKNASKQEEVNHLAEFVAALPLARLQQLTQRLPADKKPDPASSHRDFCAVLQENRPADLISVGQSV